MCLPALTQQLFGYQAGKIEMGRHTIKVDKMADSY